MRTFLFAASLMITAIWPPTMASASSIGMIDTFQSGTTEGWFAGGLGFGQLPPVPPHVVFSGGATGANDNYLLVTSQGGVGAGSRLVTMNVAQWAGDYLSAGIPTIEMDVNNLGTSDLILRLLFEDPMGAPPADVAVTTFGAALPAGSGWTHIIFPIALADFTVVNGDLNALLANVTLLRIIHNAAADGSADPLAALLGIDNISAGPVTRPGPFPDQNAVPEPSTILLTASGLAALARRYRRRHRARAAV